MPSIRMDLFAPEFYSDRIKVDELMATMTGYVSHSGLHADVVVQVFENGAWVGRELRLTWARGDDTVYSPDGRQHAIEFGGITDYGTKAMAYVHGYFRTSGAVIGINAKKVYQSVSGQIETVSRERLVELLVEAVSAGV